MKLFGYEVNIERTGFGQTNNKFNMPSLVKETRDSSINSEKNMNFSIHIAQGGIVLQRSEYDERKGSYTQKLFVVNQDVDDIGKAIGDIIKIEIMRL